MTERKIKEVLADKSIPTGYCIDALERIRDYAWLILNDAAPKQDELDPGWVWRIANDAIAKAKS